MTVDNTGIILWLWRSKVWKGFWGTWEILEKLLPWRFHLLEAAYISVSQLPLPSSKPSDSIFSLWFCFPLPPSSHHLLSIILTFLPPSFKDLCDYISALAVSSRIVLLLSRALTSSHLQSPFAMYISTAQGLGCGHLWLATIQLPTSRERKTTTGKVTSVPEEILFRRWSHREKLLGLGFPQSQPNQQ